MLQVKINMPKIKGEVVNRAKIDKKLSNLPHYKLAYISAPAGYGKTTTIVDYITRENLKCAWVSLDSDDNEPMRFWINIIAAISKCVGREDLQVSLNAAFIYSNISIDLLIGTIETISENFVIVVDDYHLINNEVIISSMEHLIRLLPSNVKLIILSRKEPDDKTAIMQAKGQALCLNMTDFVFDIKDTATFFEQKGINFSKKEIEEINKSSEGWVSALMGTYLSFNEITKEFKVAVTAKEKNIYLMFRIEVFDRYPEEIKEFLKNTAFLDKLNNSLCNAVTGKDNCGQILSNLSQNNSFIVPLDNENNWFRYHHLFQEFLESQFELLTEEEKKVRYHNAGKWYMENEQYEDGVKWLLKAGEYDTLPSLILRYILDSEEKYELSLWRKWVDSIPEEVYKDEYSIYANYSWVVSLDNDIETAEIWIKKARSCFDRLKDTMDKAKQNYIEADLIFVEMNIDVMKADLDSLFERLGKLRNIELNEPINSSGLNYFEPSFLKTPYGFRGSLKKVKIYFEFMDKLYQYLGDGSSYCAMILAEYCYEVNNLDELKQLLISNMGSIIELGSPGLIVPTFILMAKSKMTEGDIEGAFSTIEEAKNLIEQKVGTIWWYFLDVFKAKLFLQTGDTQSAEKILSKRNIGIYDKLSTERESEYIAYARLLIGIMNLDDALMLLNRLEHFTDRENRLGSLIEVRCLIAISFYKKGDFKNAFLFLEKALKSGIEDGYIRTFVEEAEDMSMLLDRYININRNAGSDKHLSYAKDLFRQTNDYVSLINHSSTDDTAQKNDYMATQFNEKEVEILQLLSDNLSNKEISDKLFLSVNTIKQYNSRIFDRLGAKNRHEAVLKARSLGILD